MVSNVCIIGLIPDFTASVSQDLAEKLDMFYANVDDIIEFELMDVKKLEEVCGTEYLIKKEKDIVRNICSYENSLLTLNYSVLNNEENIKNIRDNCLLIYLRFDRPNYVSSMKKVEKDEPLSEDVFNDRDFICKNISEFTIDCNAALSKKGVVELIYRSLLEYYS